VDATLDDAFKNPLEFLRQFVQRHVSSQKLGVLVAAGALLFAFGCSREQSAAPGVEKPGPASAVEQPATDSSPALAASLPQVG